MHAIRTTAFVLLVAFLGGCSMGEAFVDRREMEKSVKKQKLPGHDGNLTVCYGNDTPKAERERLAAEACEVYGLKAMLVRELKWQCRLTVPHLANYYCYDPDMRMANGALVDPFSNSQVKAWERERRPKEPSAEE
ncbi:hypothetical protein WV31_15085 [Magnetospirillum sp. ME-1]|uniref:hypothetical protein n=1 Tax=Magnetospirillum sp. ME-1 TaxID=1639348 RepID=UPI000A17D061|nr:hypothetical protein [Magnetospirillum sp. ME-1]ARJ66902.1 hypothetical protein WV31_15085 [Magnetospirillum sp. ME-1]